jgi:cytochrome c-type biogenesis protein CcmH
MRETFKIVRTGLQTRPTGKYPDGSGKRTAPKKPPVQISLIFLGLAAVFLWGLMSLGAADNSIEEIARDIEDNLIAPCCWSTPVSQHYSPVADEIRAEVRAMLAEGKSRDEILDHYVAQYGERILAAPRAQGFNILAYVLPWVVLVMGAWLLILLIKKLRSPSPVPSPAKTPDARYASRIEKELKEFEE